MNRYYDKNAGVQPRGFGAPWSLCLPATGHYPPQGPVSGRPVNRERGGLRRRRVGRAARGEPTPPTAWDVTRRAVRRSHWTQSDACHRQRLGRSRKMEGR
jgi:hypothetical protein